MIKQIHWPKGWLPIILLIPLLAYLCNQHVMAQGCGQFEYKLVATFKASTLEKELNELAKQGFQVKLEAQAIGLATFTMLLARERNSSQAAPRYEYKTINLAQFKKQGKNLQTQGYIVRTVMLPSTWAVGASSPVILLEHEIGTEGRYEFDFIVSPKENKLQTILDNANSSGFVPIVMLGGLIVLRRDLRNPAAEMGKREYRLLETYKIGTLQKEMNEAAQDGFRLHVTTGFNSTLMSRDYKPQESSHYEYQLAPVRPSESSVTQLNKLSSQGFVFRGTTQFGFTAIMEKSSGEDAVAKALEFKVLQTRVEATMQKEIEEACTQGFVPVNLSGGSNQFMTLLARPIQKRN